MPSGDVVLDQSIFLHVRIQKDVLAIQNRATVDVIGLTSSLRSFLLSNFSAFQNRQVQQGATPQTYIPVKIEAGWQTSDGTINTSVVFLGDVVLCEPGSGPPDIATRITCYTHQIDKTSYTSEIPPSSSTFKEYVAWAARQMGFGNNFTCETSIDNITLENQSSSTVLIGALIWDIQDVNKPNVAAFIDDDRLVVKDANKILDPTNNAKIDQFIGTPSWQEWGMSFTTLFDPNVLLAHGVDLTSIMNPTLNRSYVITALDYDLASREPPFYVTGRGAPPA